MKIQILQVGETREKNLLVLEKEYEKRISRFSDIENIVVNASKSDERERTQKDELRNLEDRLDKDAYIVALDERGKQMTSEEFSKQILAVRDFGQGKIQFIIGGSHGLHPDIIKRANHVLGFSKMTFTHEMIRVFMKEQIYRAFTILAGKTYHK